MVNAQPSSASSSSSDQLPHQGLKLCVAWSVTISRLIWMPTGSNSCAGGGCQHCPQSNSTVGVHAGNVFQHAKIVEITLTDDYLTRLTRRVEKNCNTVVSCDLIFEYTTSLELASQALARCRVRGEDAQPRRDQCAFLQGPGSNPYVSGISNIHFHTQHLQYIEKINMPMFLNLNDKKDLMRRYFVRDSGHRLL